MPATSLEDLQPISAAQLSDTHRVVARPTEERSQASRLGFYIIKVHPRLKRRLRLGAWATVVYEHPIAGHPKWQEFRSNKLSEFLTAHCRVVKLSRRETARLQSAEAPATADGIEHRVLVDQTIRNALGIPVMVGLSPAWIPMHLYPAHRSNHFRDWIAGLMGRRYLYCRVAVSSVSDMEKGVARIPENCFPMLGTEEGSGVIVERSIKCPLNRKGQLTRFRIASLRMKAFVASEEFLNERKMLEDKFPARYFPAARLLYSPDVYEEIYRVMPTYIPTVAEGLEPDIPPFFADYEFRTRGLDQDRHDLAMTPLTAVAIRREITDVFIRELQNFGIVLTISLYPLLESLARAGLSSPDGQWNWPFLIVWAAIPLFLLGLLAWRVRKQVVY
jgi:hypothetical protein